MNQTEYSRRLAEFDQTIKSQSERVNRAKADLRQTLTARRRFLATFRPHYPTIPAADDPVSLVA